MILYGPTCGCSLPAIPCGQQGNGGKGAPVLIVHAHWQGPDVFIFSPTAGRPNFPPPPNYHSPAQGPDAFLRQPYHQLRHPKIFYYGHPAVVYVNKFRVAGLLDDGIDPFIEQVGG